jgi:hypothetical protein
LQLKKNSLKKTWWKFDRNLKQSANQEETEAELFELKQISAPVATLFEKLIPDAATILS